MGAGNSIFLKNGSSIKKSMVLDAPRFDGIRSVNST